MPSSSSAIWNPELIARYDLSGPRYTSYPTAPQFSEAFAEADLKAAVERSNVSARPLSLYCLFPFATRFVITAPVTKSLRPINRAHGLTLIA